ncbi:MAG: acetylornithine deacetylase [Myxococcales bacterium]|nr:acetylornithine deacetylase [Myxococcales bacterium]
MNAEQILERLIAHPTVSHRPNGALIDDICELLDAPGVLIERHDELDDRANVLVRIGPEPDGTRGGLLLSGHLDVVPADEPGWYSDPFKLTRRDLDGHLVARGAADMKGFVALVVALARALRSRTLRQPLMLLFTRDEETGTRGARAFAESYSGEALPRAAIIGEPTGLEVVRAHKGHLGLELDIAGRSAHSGYPHLGVNAIEIAGRAIGALSQLTRELASERPQHAMLFPEVPYVPLNIGTIHGGAATNVVPDRCVLALGLRPLPGVSADALEARVRDVLAAALPADAYRLTRTSDSPPLLSPEDASIHRCLVEVMQQRGERAVSYATDAGWLQSLGVQCVIWGPGRIEVAHRPNEALDPEQLRCCGELLLPIVERFCEVR